MKAIVFLIALTGMFLQAQEKTPVPSVSVSGEGIVKVAPDRVLISVRVESQGKSAEEVKNQNDAVIDAVLKFCKKMNVDKKDVKTAYINLNKNYDYQTKKYSYIANQSLSILVTNMSNYSALMEGLMNVGINRIDGVDFQCSTMEMQQAEARKRAVKNAQQKAQEYAGALNQTIGKAIYISEDSVGRPMPNMLMKSMTADSEMAGGGSLETIAPGEIEIRTTVQVAFELK